MSRGDGPVLVVEDDADIRECLAGMQCDEGFEVFEAEHGEQAIEQLRARPDTRVILLDLMMPVMDGRMVRRAQLAEPTLAEIPIILLSAAADCVAASAELGAAKCFRKPIAWREVIQLMNAYR